MATLVKSQGYQPLLQGQWQIHELRAYRVTWHGQHTVQAPGQNAPDVMAQRGEIMVDFLPYLSNI